MKKRSRGFFMLTIFTDTDTDITLQEAISSLFQHNWEELFAKS